MRIKSVHLRLFSLQFNEAGYKNLMRITSIVNMENPELPVLTFETLTTYQDGLAVLSGGLGETSVHYLLSTKQKPRNGSRILGCFW